MAKCETGDHHPVNASCEAKRSMMMVLLRSAIMGVIAAFTAIGGVYLYAGNTFATKDQVREIKTDLRQDIKEGFDRIEKRLDRLGKP